MIDKIKNIFKKVTNLDTRRLGLVVIAIVALSITYSSAKIIQKNYILQQDIAILQQENELQEQINKNQILKNEYYKTDAYLDIAVRRFTNKVAADEKLYLVPKNVAMSYVRPVEEPQDQETKTEPQFIKNWRSWFNFLSGKSIEP